MNTEDTIALVFPECKVEIDIENLTLDTLEEMWGVRNELKNPHTRDWSASDSNKSEKLHFSEGR